MSIIQVEDVSMRFNLAQEKTETLKEYTVKLLKHQLFFNEFYALRDISFKIEPGESVALIGRNGSGKSTMMQLINGLDNAGQLTAVDSSTQGIALIRKLFNRLSDDTETTLRAVNASAGVFLPRLNAENYDLIVVAGDPENYAAACRDCLHRCTCL